MAADADGLMLATTSSDKSLKVYDVVNFGMIFLLLSSYPGRHDQHDEARIQPNSVRVDSFARRGHCRYRLVRLSQLNIF